MQQFFFSVEFFTLHLFLFLKSYFCSLWFEALLMGNSLVWNSRRVLYEKLFKIVNSDFCFRRMFLIFWCVFNKVCSCLSLTYFKLFFLDETNSSFSAKGMLHISQLLFNKLFYPSFILRSAKKIFKIEERH